MFVPQPVALVHVAVREVRSSAGCTLAFEPLVPNMTFKSHPPKFEFEYEIELEVPVSTTVMQEAPLIQTINSSVLVAKAADAIAKAMKTPRKSFFIGWILLLDPLVPYLTSEAYKQVSSQTPVLSLTAYFGNLWAAQQAVA